MKDLIEKCVDFDSVDIFMNDQNAVAVDMELDNKEPTNFEEAKDKAIKYILDNTGLTEDEWLAYNEVAQVVSEALTTFAEDRSNMVSAYEDEVLH